MQQIYLFFSFIALLKTSLCINCYEPELFPEILSSTTDSGSNEFTAMVITSGFEEVYAAGMSSDPNLVTLGGLA